MADKGYTNPDLLWSPQELYARLSDRGLRIIDVRPTHTLVHEGWIPGAIHFDLFGISLNNTASEPLQAFMWTIEHLFDARGVNLDTPVVFYEDMAGLPISREMQAPRGTTFRTRPRPELHWNADELHAHLRDADLAIIDTRSAEEYLGKN